ncbi:hypothetical protein ACFSCW_15435 [Sphingomonas tabacisoli]|uniref:Lipoprotein with Yx(FWY)xxD motif n=1 Tax=Sphingomonas tabacisoli TaxID=2249466 RepID=A0ABW4I6Q0_9SPHN
MKPRYWIGIAIAGWAAAAAGQPADMPIPPVTTMAFPAGISVAKLSDGQVFVDVKGRTLYGLDMRTVLRWTADPVQFCQASCTQEWEPLRAPADAGPPANLKPSRREEGSAPVPDWSVANGPAGPQWVYKRWHLVFTRKGEAPGSAAFDGADELSWNSLKFVPPVPQLSAPPGIKPVFVRGAYVLADDQGRLLFTGKCEASCSGWTELAAGLADGGLGDWSVSRAGDRAQYLYRGAPVFVSPTGAPDDLPAGSTMLRPDR